MNEKVDPAPTRRFSWPAFASVALGAWVLLQPGWAVDILEKTIVAIIGVIFGAVAVVECGRSRSRIKGRWFAIIGLFLSCAYLSIAALLLENDRVLYKSANRAICASNMKQIGLAIVVYAGYHDETIPKAFDDLRPYAPNLGKLLICPSARDTSRPSYQILLGGKKWNSSETMDAVVMTEVPSNHRGLGHNALYGDGHVEWVSASSATNKP
jgi:prepilin-type processing-associated H-X9-DG protein